MIEGLWLAWGSVQPPAQAWPIASVFPLTNEASAGIHILASLEVRVHKAGTIQLQVLELAGIIEVQGEQVRESQRHTPDARQPQSQGYEPCKASLCPSRIVWLQSFSEHSFRTSQKWSCSHKSPAR